ncbi:MAG TPA: hypothetical protein DIT54_01160 [Lachnospiraceae bacterium]|nr:hypothetical protein [Lachnospiraceae bacterium]HIS63529.1 hypothetical protein [Candidatus Scybalomonas excrementigallinarum]
MRYIEWLVLFILGAIGTGLANFIGYDVGFMDSLPGLVVLIVISMIAVVCTKVIPLKLPIVAYCSIIGLLSACPLSPIREFVIQAANNINFTAPFTMVGAFAGLAVSDQLKTFISQGWKILIVGIFVMTGTFLGSCIWDQLVLSVSGVI